MKNKLGISLYLVIALCIYIAFLSSNHAGTIIILEYLGIVICFAASFFIHGEKVDNIIVRVALFFTLLSDTFLLLTIDNELWAMVTFSLVQLLYAVRLLLLHRKSWRSNLWFRFLLIITLQIIGFIVTLDLYDFFLFLVLFYFANLLSNVILSFCSFRSNRKFAFGLLLFLCCDILVGLHNVDAYLTLQEGTLFYLLIHIPFNLIWFFYYPSQILITLSMLPRK